MSGKRAWKAARPAETHGNGLQPTSSRVLRTRKTFKTVQESWALMGNCGAARTANEDGPKTHSCTNLARFRLLREKMDRKPRNVCRAAKQKLTGDCRWERVRGRRPHVVTSARKRNSSVHGRKPSGKGIQCTVMVYRELHCTLSMWSAVKTGAVLVSTVSS